MLALAETSWGNQSIQQMPALRRQIRPQSLKAGARKPLLATASQIEESHGLGVIQTQRSSDFSEFCSHVSPCSSDQRPV